MDVRAVMMGLAFAAMWSSAFTSARVIVQAAPPLYTLSLRFFISGLIAVGIARAMGQTWHLSRAQWRAVVIFGLCQNAIYLGLNFIAMQQVEASLAAIIASTMPLIVALLAWTIYRESLPAMGVAGLFAGIVGVAIIMGARLSGGADLPGIALCIFAALSLAVATLTVRNTSAKGNVLMVVGLQMFVGAVALALPALLFEELVIAWSGTLVFAFWYTVLVPGVLATLVWFLLVDRIGATRSATFHFLNPFFGVVIAWVLLGEPLSLWDVFGVVIIAGGILAVQLARAEARKG
ncbi:putative DMT superfamily transporter inner membrane protein [Roseivivax sp. THAF40]|uniref:DMT family transporter n=1 Tax=unclassified Roseivivax TaxID=2639302 RepID=UPI0012690CB9|nr:MULTISPECIES: DMT family transporter [unclassified Roseivivax]QFS84240.1 putative DMT superfamily transporter inner membrane protein [Roseivivax sp. THAF197b]QFT48068.1 putative DMT superfamily transporter inner membrane protein [Roseivivax sp. THAF40]